MLKQQAFAATLWSGIDVVFRQLVQLAVMMLLARLLSPSEYGTFGLILLFAGIATVFADGGFSAALIQRQDIDRIDESTVFWFNLAAGFAAACCLFAIAPAVARFYQQPVLVPLMGAMSINVLFGAAGSIQTSLLTKRLDFRTQWKVGLASTFASGALAIWVAWHGFGVWALAWQAVSATLVSTVLLWWLGGWRPLLAFSRVSARKLLGFGGYHFVSILMDMAYTRLYTVPIGKFIGVAELGYYTNADTTQQMPGGLLMRVLTRVAFPMFAAAHHDKAKLKRGMQLAIRGAMVIHAPAMLGMAALTEPLVRVLFGDRWLPVVPVLRILCLAGVLLPLHVLNLNCLMAQGHSRLMLRLELVKKTIGVALLVLGIRFGLQGVAWAMVVTSAVGLIVNAHYTRLLVGYGVGAQVRDFLPIILSAAVMAMVVATISPAFEFSPLVRLICLAAIGGVIYGMLMLLTGSDAFHDVVALVRGPAGVVRGAGDPR